MENDNNSRLPKRAKTQLARPELTVVDTDSSRHPANDERGHHQPHDKFIKCAFKNKEIAVDFFAAHLADMDFSRQVLEGFSLSNNEHQRLYIPKLVDDIVYRGKFEERDCYILVEHQSSFDKTIISRLLEYSAALMKEHIAQGQAGQPIMIPICLYHEPHRTKKPVNNCNHTHKSMLERLYKSEQGAEYLKREYPKIVVVDLTIVDDKEIGRHGHAAIVEWLLKDVQLPADAFLQKAKKHLELAGFNSQETGSADFRSSLLEYILRVYGGDKTSAEVVNELCEVIPQEREIMGKLADTLRAEGIQQGIQQGMQQGMQQVAGNLLGLGINLDIVKQATHLSDEELDRLSPNSAGSPTSPQQMEPSPSHGMLAQRMSSSSATEQLSSSINRKAISDNSNTNMIFPTDNGPS
ncbi:MAG: Rpn family recombination-promoting nuclease/putative transposase [Candidatus Symbiodolus clandestinus]